MARLMSAALTVNQVLDESKTVSRRIGWQTVRRGEELVLVRKGMGLKLGERVERLKRVRVIHVWRERLNKITDREVEREGFPGMRSREFVRMFMQAHKCAPTVMVTRIEWAYIGLA